jgi:hypothetical protein
MHFTLKHAVCASLVVLVTGAVTNNFAQAQTAKTTDTMDTLNSGLRAISPFARFGGGKTSRAIADAQAAAALAGVVTASSQPAVAPPPHQAPLPPPTTTPASTTLPEGLPKLRPDQKYAVELSIAGVDPAQRPFIYGDMAKNLAPYDEKQIAALVKGLEANATAETKANAKKLAASDAPITGALSNEDFTYNRAQYEPAIRKAWTAQKAYDDFVNAKLTAYCPKRDEVARFGSAWRYELHQFVTPSATASWSADTDVQVMGAAYAPQDGKYNFDFSKVRTSFDEKAVDAAVKEGCESYAAAGKAFLAKVDPMISKQDWNGAFKLEQTANAGVEPIRAKMNAKLEPLSPNYGYPLMNALMNGKRVKS